MLKVSSRTVAALAVACLGLAGSVSQAAVLSEGFEDVSALPAAGWKLSNQSTDAADGIGWRQGSAGPNPNNVNTAADGPATSFAFDDYEATGDETDETGATISDWLVTPALAFDGVDHTLTFKTRTATDAQFADRLEVRLSSTTNDTGTSPTDVGAFSTVLLTINPNLESGPEFYPDTYTTFTVNIAGSSVPSNGYIAFRYFVTDGGANGNNSNNIGLDTVNVSPVPEPTTIAALGLTGAGLLARRRRS